MGKKNSCNGGGGGGGEAVAREFVLKVAMHCRCHGCTDKLRAAVRDLTLAPGVEVADCAAAESSGEVHLLTTADPDRLRRRVRRATGKKVDLLPPPRKDRAAKKGADLTDDAALNALLADLQLHGHAHAQAPARQHYGGQNAAQAWAAQQHQQQLMGLGLGGGGGWNGGAAGYGAECPWPSASSYYPAAPAAAYGYAPQAPAPVYGNAGYYGAGGAPAWLGY